MDYDTYGSTAVELAIDLANADRDAGPDWATAFLRAHDEWFSPGSVLDLSPDETDQAATTADLVRAVAVAQSEGEVMDRLDRKSTRLNSSHANISYAVFCLKKK